MTSIKEIYYFLQWYRAKQIAKFRGIIYKPALWHFSVPTFILGLGVVFTTKNIETLQLAGYIVVCTLGITATWYFIKMWFLWDWIDYQREKQRTFDALKSDSKHI
jgi:hypothetical protein